MKNSVIIPARSYLILILFFLITSGNVGGQDVSQDSPPLPENISKIVSASCMPCHSSGGGMLARTKLNFSEWQGYSPDKQKKKAGQMYKEIKKDAMPPEDAREANPDIIPTKEQVEIIKNWADSF